MVIAPASTGIASSSRNTVTRIDHTNSGILCSVMPGARMLKMVVMKLIAPRIEEAPARCSDRMREIDRRPGMPGDGRQRRIEGPAGADAVGAGWPFDEGRGEQQRERGRQQPERDVVHARERHVRRADHQRHDPVAETADHRRHHHEEDHDEAVRGREHIEGMGVRGRTARRGSCSSIRIAIDISPPITPAHHGEHEVHRADVLVVRRIDETAPPGRMAVIGFVGAVRRSRGYPFLTFLRLYSRSPLTIAARRERGRSTVALRSCSAGLRRQR